MDPRLPHAALRCVLLAALWWPPLTATAEAPPYRFPLKVSESGRYLVDQDGRPFRIHGDTAWELIVDPTSAEVDTYLANRKGKRFNTILVNLIERKAWTTTSRAPANRNGDAPFLTEGDMSTPNDKYFAYADTVLTRAAMQGFLVLLVPAYIGYEKGEEGWASEMIANEPRKCRVYGRYIGQRYRAFPNVIWVNGGDYTPIPGEPVESCALEVMRGVREFASQLQTAHWGPKSIASDQPTFAPALELEAAYSGWKQIAYPIAKRAYARTPPRPAFNIEANYEGASTGPEPIRMQMWWSVLSSIAGVVFGNNPLWSFGHNKYSKQDDTWEQAMERPGSLDFQRLGSLLDSIAWWTLVPDETVVLAGGGRKGGSDYVTAASSGRVLVAYLPPTRGALSRWGRWTRLIRTASRSVTLDMRKLAGPVRGRWYDPTNGTYHTVGDSPSAASGTATFTTPGSNSSGDDDWVLVLSPEFVESP